MKIIHIQFKVRAVNTSGVHTSGVLHEKSSINDCALFASVILADEAIHFDNNCIFSQISDKHEDCGMPLLNTRSFRLFRKVQS